MAQAQASLHQGQFEHADAPALAAGSTSPAGPAAGPKKDEETPGTKAYDLAQQKAALQAIPDTPPGARQQALDRMKAQLQAEAQVFTKDKMDAPTGDGKNGTLTGAQAAQQRITNARELMIRMEALGLSPSDVKMDPRMAEAAEKQQQMVDGLARQAGDLSPEQIKIAQEARAQRELSRQDPSKVSNDDAKKLRDRMQAALGDAKMDDQSVEKRLLMQGFTPDEIADHFTSRDKDADVVKDPNNPNDPKNNTASRGDPLHPELVAGGDKNPDGTTRRPMTPQEADRAVDMNQVLDESWHEGAKFGKIDPTDPTKPAQFVKDNQVSRMEGTVNQDLANKAEVCLGAGVYDRAKQRAEQLQQAQAAAGGDATAGSAPWVPKMLRTDTTATTGDPKDGLPGFMQRTRGESGPPQDDPRTGLGYSETLRMSQPVVPNQERTIDKTAAVALPSDLAITRSDQAGPQLVYNPRTGKMEPPPTPSPPPGPTDPTVTHGGKPRRRTLGSPPQVESQRGSRRGELRHEGPSSDRGEGAPDFTRRGLPDGARSGRARTGSGLHRPRRASPQA